MVLNSQRNFTAFKCKKCKLMISLEVSELAGSMILNAVQNSLAHEYFIYFMLVLDSV